MNLCTKILAEKGLFLHKNSDVTNMLTELGVSERADKASQDIFHFSRPTPYLLQARSSRPPYRIVSMDSRRAACDPCRKAKLACGHERPVCARCSERKASTCVYRASPFKRIRTSHSNPSTLSMQNQSPRYMHRWHLSRYH